MHKDVLKRVPIIHKDFHNLRQGLYSPPIHFHQSQLYSPEILPSLRLVTLILLIKLLLLDKDAVVNDILTVTLHLVIPPPTRKRMGWERVGLLLHWRC
jgi:hypothetical protein